MMSSLQEQQRPIDIAIINGLVGSTPERWTKIVMEVAPRAGEDGKAGLTILIGSPEGHPDVVKPHRDLVAALGQLWMLYDGRGQPWSKVSYRLEDAGGGRWGFKAEFTYPPGE